MCFRKGIKPFTVSLFERNSGSTAAGLSGKHGDLALQPVDKAK